MSEKTGSTSVGCASRAKLKSLATNFKQKLTGGFFTLCCACFTVWKKWRKRFTKTRVNKFAGGVVLTKVNLVAIIQKISVTSLNGDGSQSKTCLITLDSGNEHAGFQGEFQ